MPHIYDGCLPMTRIVISIISFTREYNSTLWTSTIQRVRWELSSCYKSISNSGNVDYIYLSLYRPILLSSDLVGVDTRFVKSPANIPWHKHDSREREIPSYFPKFKVESSAGMTVYEYTNHYVLCSRGGRLDTLTIYRIYGEEGGTTMYCDRREGGLATMYCDCGEGG